jgi:carboxylesterase type B
VLNIVKPENAKGILPVLCFSWGGWVLGDFQPISEWLEI